MLFVTCSVNYQIVQLFILKINRLAMPNTQPRKVCKWKLQTKLFATENK